MEGLLSVLHDASNPLLNGGLGDLGAVSLGLVTTTGKDLSVVCGTTTVPGEKLREYQFRSFPYLRDEETYVGSVGGNVSEGALGGDVDKSGLQLLRGHIRNGEG